jgi:hypothetical protein
MRGIGRVGRRGPKALKRRKARRPWDASEGVSKPWRCPASPPDRPAPCFLPDATQGRSLWVIIIKIWYYPLNGPKLEQGVRQRLNHACLLSVENLTLWRAVCFVSNLPKGDVQQPASPPPSDRRPPTHRPAHQVRSPPAKNRPPHRHQHRTPTQTPCARHTNGHSGLNMNFGHFEAALGAALTPGAKPRSEDRRRLGPRGVANPVRTKIKGSETAAGR